jgi:hypothetical protein
MPRTRRDDIETIQDRLKEVQRARGLNDGEMAAHMRVTSSAWRHVRTGRRCMGLSMVYWAAREFPEAMPTMLIYLLGVGQDSQQTRDIPAPPGQADEKGAA